ncbi:MAG: mechanosensitive ion channel, partial [Myxococcales bacterium]|nr:mechanosensitive ion channel [Myxococcales bacterium]
MGDGQAGAPRSGTASAAGAGTSGNGGAETSSPEGRGSGADGEGESGAAPPGAGGAPEPGSVHEASGAANAGGTGTPSVGAPSAGPTAEANSGDAVAPPTNDVADAGVPPEDAALDAGVPFVDASVAEEVAEPLEPDAGPATAPVETTAPPEAGGAAPTTTVVQVPMPFVQASESIDPWAGLREVIPGIPTGGIKPIGLLGLLALLALFSTFIERLRGRLLRDGLLPTLLAVTQVVVRLLALLIALALVIQVVPANIRWVVYFILIASGAALGWSMRDVMPDLIAGVVIVFERRIRRGIWIRSDSFSGAVERVGLRSSWLRDSKGHRVAVPNRLLMQAPVVSDEEGERV